MRVLKSVIDIIDGSISDYPPETGGILGSCDDGVISEVVVDLPNAENIRPCSYFPNVDFLNSKIRLWQNKGVSFKGIFHTHFCGVRTLSEGDKKYIKAIVNAMPSEIKILYFPIYVLPDREMVCYKAVNSNGIIGIQGEDLIIE